MREPTFQGRRVGRWRALACAPTSVQLGGFARARATLFAIVVAVTVGGLACGTEGRASDFSMELYQGQQKLGSESLNFADLRGQPVVLNFWAGLCPPCRAEIPHFEEFYREFEGRALLVGLDVGQFTGLGNQDDAQALLRDLAVTYPAGFTLDESVMKDYQVLTMPTTVFVDADGKIFRKWSGILDQATLTKITEEMLAQ